MEHQLAWAVIPQPRPDPLLKNLKDLDPKGPIQGLMRLARTYGPIFRLSLPGRDMIVVSSQELVNELCDEHRFDKKVHAPWKTSGRSLAMVCSLPIPRNPTGRRRTAF